jgi:hypothetical protein
MNAYMVMSEGMEEQVRNLAQGRQAGDSELTWQG